MDVKNFCSKVVRDFKKKYSHRLRYFFISEYGPETLRPHYHGFFFDWPQSKRLAYRFVADRWKYGQVTIRKADPDGGVYAVKDMIAPHTIPDDAMPGVLVRSVRPAIGAIHREFNDSLPLDDWRQLRFRDKSGKLIPYPDILLKKIYPEELIKAMRFEQKQQPDFESLVSRDYRKQLLASGATEANIPFLVAQAYEHGWRSMKDKRADELQQTKQLWQTT